MRVFLSGMPELRLGLNDKVLFDNTGREYQGHGLCMAPSPPELDPGLKLELREGHRVKEHIDPKHLEIFSHRLQDSYEN